MSTIMHIDNLRQLRQHLGLSQTEFWHRVGVTQSGGSRYEAGRNMPKPVRELVRLVHVEKIDISKVCGVDWQICQRLRQEKPALYQQLKTLVEKEA